MNKEKEMKKIVNQLVDINIEELLQKEFKNNYYLPENISYWYDKIKSLDNVFIIPKTTIISLPYNIYKIVTKDIWDKNDEKEIDDFLSPFTSFPENCYFIKSGNFSGKFDFNNCCKCTDMKNLKNNIRHIFYNSSLLGCPVVPEFAIREFIKTENNRPTIYNGLKLNTEFRVFYNFDKNEIVDIINYWDRNTMIHNLNNDYMKKDYDSFMSVIDEIEKEFLQEAPYLYTQCEENLNHNLPGYWTIDFMLIKEHKFALIDMALAQSSYYIDKVFSNNLENILHYNKQ